MKKFLLFLFISFSILSCQNGGTKTELEFVDVDSEEADWEVQGDDSLKALKGQTWKIWSKSFKECMANQWINKPYYFGPSNTITLGSVTTKNYDQLVMTLDKVFTQEEINKMIQPGTPTNCEIKQEIETDLEVLLEGEVEKTVTASLNAALQNAKKTTTTIDGYQVDNLVIGELKSQLSNATGKKKEFLDYLHNDKYVLLNKIIKVSGFTTEIELNNNISAELEAELANQPQLSIGNAGLKVKFSKKNNTTISVKSLGEFVVFGKFIRTKKIDV
ncbi:MAG: hypothetical protein POELPBGB_01348 [Bacteroidia bacterium]|nr:hypothetical protein [Bacteroidia bacterium]